MAKAITKPTPHVIGPEKLKSFILGGKAIITMQSESGTHFTYMIEQLEDKNEGLKNLWFLKVLTGPDSYTFAGTLFDKGGELIYKHSDKSVINSPLVPSIKGFLWMIKLVNIITNGDADNQLAAVGALSRMTIKH